MVTSEPADDPAESTKDIAALFRRVGGGRVSSLIVEQIRAAIEDRLVVAGDRLPSERELSEQFGVSRVTVRDALRTLETSGLIEIRMGAHGGGFVTVPPPNVLGGSMADLFMMAAFDADEVAETRLILETGIISLVVQRATEEDIAALRSICERSQEAVKANAYDVVLSWEFHAALAAAAHNRALERVAGSFRGPLSMHNLRVRNPRGPAHKASVRDHVEILKALEERDEAAAHAAMSSHLLRGTRSAASQDPR